MKKIYPLVMLVMMSLISNFSKAQTGSTCALAHLVPSTPFTATGLSTTADNYDVGPCASSATHMAGNDYVFTYTPTTTGPVSITLSNVSTLLGTGIFVTDACPDATTVNCVGSAITQTGAAILSNLTLNSGTTYYILVSSRVLYTQGQSTTFDINIQGCSANPTATFTDVQNGLNVTFTNTSTGGTTYEWLFGDELIPGNWYFGDTTTNPVHAYAGYGTYTVSMVATSSCGATDTITTTITLVCPGTNPVATFTYTQSGATFNFTNTSTGGTSYQWLFGDELINNWLLADTNANPIHAYTTDSTYTVSMIATNECGSDTVTIQLVVIGTAFESINKSNQFTCFPNPITENLHIVFKNTITQTIELKLYSALGCEIYSREIAGSDIQLTIPLSNFEKGIYYLKLFSDNGTQIRRIVLE